MTEAGEAGTLARSAEGPTLEDVTEYPCLNHSNTLTAVACGKCSAHICPRCMVFTPVGIRCKPCAQLRPPAQFDVSKGRLLRAGVLGFIVATIAWYIGLHLFFLAWVVAIATGLTVADVASRATRRRVSRGLEILVGADIIGGFLLGRYLDFLTSPDFGLPHGTAVLTTVVSINDPLAMVMLVLAVAFGILRLHP